jgi:hypothetical protein
MLCNVKVERFRSILIIKILELVFLTRSTQYNTFRRDSPL